MLELLSTSSGELSNSVSLIVSALLLLLSKRLSVLESLVLSDSESIGR
jgi:hypothetical protein